MSPGNIRKTQATEKKRICRALKRLGITKKELAGKSGFHYQTVKWALNPQHPGWSPGVIAAAKNIINPVEEKEHDTATVGAA